MVHLNETEPAKKMFIIILHKTEVIYRISIIIKDRWGVNNLIQLYTEAVWIAKFI